MSKHNLLNYFKMRLFLIAIFIVFSTWSFSQGNLQFNQVINLSYNNNFSTSFTKQNVGSLTVPTGKVWKIESGSSHTINSNYNNPSPIGLSLFLGDFCVFGVDNSNFGSLVHYPIWLSAGVYSVVMHSQSSGNKKCALSIIEFNIIP